MVFAVSENRHNSQNDYTATSRVQKVLEGRCIECNKPLDLHLPYECSVAAERYIKTNKLDKVCNEMPTEILVGILLSKFKD